MADVDEMRETEIEGKPVVPGVVYISSIPKRMGPVHIRQLWGKFGELGRIYLAANQKAKKSTHKYKEDDFHEGWVEFKKKKHAKICANTLNAQPIEGTKKKSKFAGQMWNIKYLVIFVTKMYKFSRRVILWFSTKLVGTT